jgi:hypothetical protein
MSKSLFLISSSVALASAAPVWSHDSPPAEQADSSSIGYLTVADARAALTAKSGVTFRTENGWTIAKDDVEIAIWLFAPPDHPAYPSVIKRTTVNRNNKSFMQTSVKCEATKDICDKYFAD